MKITKKEFDSLYTDTITKKEDDTIISKIDKRFADIIYHIIPSLKTANRGWFDYGNCSYDSEKSGGYFDPQRHKEWIDVGGEYITLPEPFDYQIPTRWLWEDFEDDFKAQVEAYKKAEEAEKLKAQTTAKKRKEKNEKLREAIKNKLTDEELKIVSFKV